MVSAKSPIGMFDSGLGGLTVFKAVRKLMPHENLIYFGDTARLPYGTKSKTAVISFSKEIAALLEKRGVKLIIIACNTASSMALDAVRSVSKIPVIGVIEPGARSALRAGKGGRILVTGTEGCVSSGAYTKALKKLNGSVQVVEKACPLFVPLVEEGWCENKITRLVADEYLAEFKNKKFDSVILGCTHYPLLKAVISGALGGRIPVIDSAEAAAQEAHAVLEARKLLNNSGAGRAGFIVSDAPQKFKLLAGRLLGIKAASVEVVRF